MKFHKYLSLEHKVDNSYFLDILGSYFTLDLLS